MTDKQNKIHSLGPRKMSSTGRAFFNTTSQNNFYNKPLLPVVTVPQPQIRYLLVQHPQFDTLVKELTALRSKYDQLLVKFEQKSSQQSLRANIQQVIQSTHNIEVKMSRIVQDANKMSSNNDQKQNQPTIQSEKARHEKQCLLIIQTVNKATQKIEQLQQKNIKLEKQIQNQRQWKQGLQKQNKRLRLMLQNMERQKEDQIQKLKSELTQLKEKKTEVVHETIISTNQRISNSHYLVQNDMNHQGEEVSGFSRLTINGQASRLSKVYQ